VEAVKETHRNELTEIMLQVYVNGPPGSGKTTLSKRLAASLKLDHLSTGDILREHIKTRTELGKIAKKCIAAKTLVPDEVVVDMLADRIARSTQGYILDGFPRTTEQTKLLRFKSIVPNVALLLELPRDEIKPRIQGRRMDLKTGDIYHNEYHMPSDPAIAARLIQRDDDIAERIPARIEAYEHYGKQTNREFTNLAYDIDADRSIRDVVAEATDILRSVSKIKVKKEFSNQVTPPPPMTKLEPEEIEFSPPKPARQISRVEDTAARVAAARVQKIEQEIKSIDLDFQTPLEDNNYKADTAKLVEMERFKTMLVSGFDVIKHGRRGAPHTRTLFADVEFKRLFWQKPDKKELKPKLDTSIALSDVIEVVQGMKTEVFKRSGDSSKGGRYFSLIADDRTLDIEASSDEICALLVMGFTELTQLN
ncbi:adenylate kinase, partial [Thraustotheca clavata]